MIENYKMEVSKEDRAKRQIRTLSLLLFEKIPTKVTMKKDKKIQLYRAWDALWNVYWKRNWSNSIC